MIFSGLVVQVLSQPADKKSRHELTALPPLSWQQNTPTGTSWDAAQNRLDSWDPYTASIYISDINNIDVNQLELAYLRGFIRIFPSFLICREFFKSQPASRKAFKQTACNHMLQIGLTDLLTGRYVPAEKLRIYAYCQACSPVCVDEIHFF
jgi:hypothetical protein